MQRWTPVVLTVTQRRLVKGRAQGGRGGVAVNNPAAIIVQLTRYLRKSTVMTCCTSKSTAYDSHAYKP